jgi:hypothetical protein
MTAVASILEPIGFDDLPIILRRLHEDEFWDIIDQRLNGPNGLRVIQRTQPDEKTSLLQKLERQQFLCLLPACLPSNIEDNLFIEMSETELEDPKNPGCKIRRYYLEAAKYAGRISAGNFEGQNARYKPTFEIHYKDFSSRLQHELQSLREDSPATLADVVQNSVFRIFKARHKMIFYDYIEHEGLNWRFVAD